MPTPWRRNRPGPTHSGAHAGAALVALLALAAWLACAPAAAFAQPDREPTWTDTDGNASAVGDPIKIDSDPFPPQGSIVGWGSKVVGVDLSKGFVAVAAGGTHSLGLKSDGSIVAWGRNHFGQCDVPQPNSGFIAVAGNSQYSLGIRIDTRSRAADGLRTDWDRNGIIDTRDVVAFLNDWTAGDADFNADGHTDTRDLTDFLAAWAAAR